MASAASPTGIAQDTRIEGSETTAAPADANTLQAAQTDDTDVQSRPSASVGVQAALLGHSNAAAINPDNKISPPINQSAQTAGDSGSSLAETPQPAGIDPSGVPTSKPTDALAKALPAGAPDPAAPAVPSAEIARAETRAAQTTDFSLSTTSRSSVETTAQIAAQIVRKLEGRSTRFEMALTPDDLGRVDVSLEIDKDGQLAARLAFDNPVAATELRGRVDELRRQLQDAGFKVGDDALSFAQRDPSAGQEGFGRGTFDRENSARNARAFGAASRLSADAGLAAAPARWIPLTLTPERVDMKV